MRPRLSNKRRGSVALGVFVTFLVGVGVFIAYRANHGIPGASSYNLSAEVPNAASLVRGSEVRIGGVRGGVLDSIKPKQTNNGEVVAELGLKLDNHVKKLPIDSTLIIRPRSTLGMKYVEVIRGKKLEVLHEGGRLSLKSARPEPVELDQVLNVFDKKTRASAQKNIVELGDGLADRGQSINSLIRDLNPLLPKVEQVAQALSETDTQLVKTIGAVARTARAVAPVSQAQGELFVNLNRTLSAISAREKAYQDFIERSPAAIDAGISSSPKIRSFLANTSSLMRQLRPGVKSLRKSAPDLAAGVHASVPVFTESVDFNRGRLQPLLKEVQSFGEDPLIPIGLNRLGQASRSIGPTINYVTPAQTACNYVSLFFRNVSSLLSEGDGHGTWQRFIIVASPEGQNSEGGPSSQPASGPDSKNFLHNNPYPLTAAPGQRLVCEAGNERYVVGRTITTNSATPLKAPDRRRRAK